MRKQNPWIKKLKECAKEYQIEKHQSKLKMKRNFLTKGQKTMKNAVNHIEKKAIQRKKIEKDFEMIRRIKGTRF